jgi:hypothetical protein
LLKHLIWNEKTVKLPLKLTGIGLRAVHYQEFLAKPPAIAWLEIHSENYFADGGKALFMLEKLRHDYPISLHGVSLSLGSCDELNWQYLHKLRNLMTRVDACLVSDHLSWSSIDGHYLHDLLPLPYTEEALAHIITRIKQVQDYLNRQILIENISSYIRYDFSTIPEQEFLREIALQTGCGILLDINNIYITTTNLGGNAAAYITAIPPKLVQELHLAGFITTTMQHKSVLIDSHNRAIVPAVWELYAKAIQHLGAKPTIIEWDSDIPSLATVCQEATRAEQIMRENHVATKLTG